MSSAVKSEEEMSPHSRELLEEVNKDMKEASEAFARAFATLDRETNRVRKEMDALDEAAKKLEHVHFSKKVKLDVGGHHFSTSVATLSKDPGSMLHAMFSGRFDTKPSEDGSYFIDRDGTHFRYILNYLRTGELIVPDDELPRIWKELLAEAEFYQIEGIIKALTAKPQPSAFKDSVILSSDQRQTLITWLKEKQAFTDIKLLYRASRDGWAASDFHRFCDNKGPTVTVVKSGNYIFGGYTEQHWESGYGKYKRAPKSFLFSLVNPGGLPPTKMPLKAEQEEYAIYCDSGCGPIFGEGNDLYIASSPNSYNCYGSLNNTYQCPAGQDAKKFLTGDEFFTVSEMEVFSFKK